MHRQQEYWETLQKKYEEKNKALQKKEMELRYRLEAMDAVIGDTGPPPKAPFPPAPRMTPPSASATIPPQQNFPYSDYTSCTCPPPQEKVGLFKAICSMFSSSKPKDIPTSPTPSPVSPSASPPSAAPPSPPTPHAPQYVPTKEVIQHVEDIPKISELPNMVTNVDMTPKTDNWIGENCMCDPCEGGEVVPVQKDDDVCSCSGGSAVSNDNQSDECNCSICTRSTNSSKKDRKSDDASCICSICSTSTAKSSKNNGKKDLRSNDRCTCTAGSNGSAGKNSKTSDKKSNRSNETCNCSICSKMTDNKDLCYCNYGREGVGSMEVVGKQIPTNDFLRPSQLSLKSLDLYYMKNIHDLATQHKNLLKNITTLEHKAKIYDDVFNEYKNINFTDNDTKCPCTPCCGTQNTNSDSDQRTTAELKLENFLLKNELKDMRLEVRQYLERMEGPMQFKIESERYKCLQLEQKLEEAAKKLAETQEFYQKEINSIKMQLCTANTNIYNLTTENEKLNENVDILQAKCTELQDDLVRQKISEAETLKRMKAAMDAQNNANVVKDECSLHQIARELSKILQECEPCGECINLPDDLTEAARLLKSLTDLVDQKLPKTQQHRSQSMDAVVLKKPSPVKDYQRKSLDDGAIGTCQPKAPEVMAIETTLQASGHSRLSQSQSREKDVLEEAAPEVCTTEEATAEEITEKESEHPIQEEQNYETGLTPTGQDEQKSATGSEQNEQKPEIVTSTGGDEEKSETGSTASPKVRRRSSVPTESAATPSDVEKPTAPIVPKKKLSCKCVESRKSVPVKEPPVEEVKKKKSCECSIKKEKESARAQSVGKRSCKCNKKEGKVHEIPPSAPRPPEKVPNKKSCKCSKKAEINPPTSTEVARLDDSVEKIWPKGSQRFALSHAVTASRSKELLKSETSIKCLKVKENFPFDVDTQVDVLNRPPDGVHVTTTITKSGTLEVITEGPEGVIETTLVYTNSGNVEVVTQILEYHPTGKSCKRGTKSVTDSSEPKPLEAIEPPTLKTVTSEPGKTSKPGSTVNLTAPVSGPALMNPNCQCVECPGLEEIAGPEGVQNVIGEDILQPETVQPEAVQPETLPETTEVKPAVPNPDCGCGNRPNVEPPTEGVQNVVQEEIPEPKTVQPEMLPPEPTETKPEQATNPDCLCLKCPLITPVKEQSFQKVVQPYSGTAPQESVPPEDSTVPQESVQPEDSTVPQENVQPEDSTVAQENVQPEDSTIPQESAVKESQALVPSGENDAVEDVQITQDITETSLGLSIHADLPDDIAS